jgi:hypothetical protein
MPTAMPTPMPTSTPPTTPTPTPTTTAININVDLHYFTFSGVGLQVKLHCPGTCRTPTAGAARKPSSAAAAGGRSQEEGHLDATAVVRRSFSLCLAISTPSTVSNFRCMAWLAPARRVCCYRGPSRPSCERQAAGCRHSGISDLNAKSPAPSLYTSPWSSGSRPGTPLQLGSYSSILEHAGTTMPPKRARKRPSPHSMAARSPSVGHSQAQHMRQSEPESRRSERPSPAL